LSKFRPLRLPRGVLFFKGRCLCSSSITGKEWPCSGYHQVGVFGSGLLVGAQFVLIQVSAGTLGSNGNGNPYQWQLSGPIISVN
jgi:hypothetical protein